VRNFFTETSTACPHWSNSTHTHPFNGPLSVTTRVSRYQKVKPISILLRQEKVSGSGSGSGISRAVCKSAPRSRQITTPAPHHSVFRGPPCRPTNSAKALKANYIAYFIYKRKMVPFFLPHGVDIYLFYVYGRDGRRTTYLSRSVVVGSGAEWSVASRDAVVSRPTSGAPTDADSALQQPATSRAHAPARSTWRHPASSLHTHGPTQPPTLSGTRSRTST